MVEIAFLIIAIALAAFLIALIPTLLRTRHVVKEVEETVAVLRTDINVTLHQTNEILAKANVLVEDVNEKVQTIDPLFVAVAELSESVSDLNTEARYLGAKASAAGASVGKAGSAFAIGKGCFKTIGKKTRKIRRSFMSKFLNTLIIGAASGAAAAYFFTTEKGKAVKARIDEEIASFKEDPKAYQNQVVEKVSDYKELAVDTFQDYKTKFENGDITATDLTKAVQEKTAQVADFAKESFELIKEKTAQVTPEQANVKAETKAIVDDIFIDIKDISEEVAESN